MTSLSVAQRLRFRALRETHLADEAVDRRDYRAAEAHLAKANRHSLKAGQIDGTAATVLRSLETHGEA